MSTPALLNPGDIAPDFSLPNQLNKQVKLSSFRGRKVVLFFYPEDDTPLCTAEACGIRDNYPAIEEKNAVVIGVSPDDVPSHARYHAKFSYPFDLLADPGKKVMTQYGTWGEKNLYGKTVIGTLRYTFLIDEHGAISKVFRKVNTNSHGTDILRYI